MGEYPSQGSNQLISREWISRARSRWDAYVSKHGDSPPIASSGVMGLDVGEFGSDANAVCFRYGEYVERNITWQGVDTIATAERAVVEFKTRKTICGIKVDATGIGNF